MTTAELHRRYELAARRWWDAIDLDRRFGTTYAAALVGPMRAAYAAYRESTR